MRAIEVENPDLKDVLPKTYNRLGNSVLITLLKTFNAIPMGHDITQLVLFPQDSNRLLEVAEKTGLVLEGPQRAFLIQGDDQLGSLVEIHQKLADGRVNVAASIGVTDGRGGYGYIVHVRPEDFDQACSVLSC